MKQPREILGIERRHRIDWRSDELRQMQGDVARLTAAFYAGYLVGNTDEGVREELAAARLVMTGKAADDVKTRLGEGVTSAPAVEGAVFSHPAELAAGYAVGAIGDVMLPTTFEAYDTMANGAHLAKPQSLWGRVVNLTGLATLPSEGYSIDWSHRVPEFTNRALTELGQYDLSEFTAGDVIDSVMFGPGIEALEDFDAFAAADYTYRHVHGE